MFAPAYPPKTGRILVLSFTLLLGLFQPAVAEDSAGSVIAARKNAWAERHAAQNLLASKSEIHVGDTLITNPVGRLQVLFRDDSVLMLAPDSRSTVSEYVYAEGRKSSFSINVAQGLTRLISGNMAVGDPGAIRIETPRLSLGIKGTDLTVKQDGASTTVTLLEGGPVDVLDKGNGEHYALDAPGTTMFFGSDMAGPSVQSMSKADWAALRDTFATNTADFADNSTGLPPASASANLDLPPAPEDGQVHSITGVEQGGGFAIVQNTLPNEALVTPPPVVEPQPPVAVEPQPPVVVEPQPPVVVEPQPPVVEPQPPVVEPQPPVVVEPQPPVVVTPPFQPPPQSPPPSLPAGNGNPPSLGDGNNGGMNGPDPGSNNGGVNGLPPP
ncbi:hypothetical protein AGMMS49960_07760 [Betaproteobacteria bacterium]|nr:hypothetical protein AGMMS49543_06200 [Betaproteobacteria bacterium]GHU00221.1 hypothetical protein AGMMS49960_07760 [Betaproteobacteria bacterium]GHU23639.1 hypothetical protein AGMMS50243_25420 [Betaproteobacteria bacterium]